MEGTLPLGAACLDREHASFVVWSPASERVELRILSPRHRAVPLKKGPNGYHHAVVEGIPPGTLYVYRLDGLIERPDPASRYQPHGPRGPSCVMDSRFAWRDRRWKGMPLSDCILYEDPRNSIPFEDRIPSLESLKGLGITALRVRLEQAAQPFSVPAALGGPAGLKKIVDACHRRGLAVMLALSLFEPDTEGELLGCYGPYFAVRDHHLNMDGAHSDEVRRYFIECVTYWFREFHVDALDVGTIDDLVDLSPTPLLEELAVIARAESKTVGRPLQLMARSRRNDPRVIRSREDGGMGLNALWNTDFELALEGILTCAQVHPSFDAGSPELLKKAYLEGFVFSGEFSESWMRRHGRSSRNLPGERFLVRCPRLEDTEKKNGATAEAQKLIGAALLLSPFVPLLNTESAKGPRPGWDREKAAYLRELSNLRKELRSAGLLDKQCMGALCYEEERILLVRFWRDGEDLIVVFHFGTGTARVPLPFPSGEWALRLDSADRRWGGPGSALPAVIRGGGGDAPLALAPLSCAVYLRRHGG